MDRIWAGCASAEEALYTIGLRGNATQRVYNVAAYGTEQAGQRKRLKITYPSTIAVVYFQSFLRFTDAARPRVVHRAVRRHLGGTGRPLHDGTVTVGG